MTQKYYCQRQSFSICLHCKVKSTGRFRLQTNLSGMQTANTGCIFFFKLLILFLNRKLSPLLLNLQQTGVLNHHEHCNFIKITKKPGEPLFIFIQCQKPFIASLTKRRFNTSDFNLSANNELSLPVKEKFSFTVISRLLNHFNAALNRYSPKRLLHFTFIVYTFETSYILNHGKI